MAYYKDSFERVWEDESLCTVCSADMGKSMELVCSATCQDIQDLKYARENDCYA